MTGERTLIHDPESMDEEEKSTAKAVLFCLFLKITVQFLKAGLVAVVKAVLP